MKALSLHGPWAYYERKAAENECRIGDLESDVRRLRFQTDDLQQKLSIAEAEAKQLKDQKVPSLQSDHEKAQSTIENLQAELARERMERSEEQRQLISEVSSLTQELQKLSADNAVLRSELAKTVHQKQLTSSKLEQIRKKLGLTESEAKAFIQELDEARAASKALREENKELAADNTHLKQQMESRSQHCMTLIGENKRLLEQLAELRMQLQKQHGELWQAKTEQQAAVSAARQLQQQGGPAGRRVVVREWSQQQGGTSSSSAGGADDTGGPSSSAATALGGSSVAGVRATGKQNRPPWSDVSGSKARGEGSTAAATGTTAGGCVTKPVHIPIGLKPPAGGGDACKAGVVRQALAVRQQRLATTASTSTIAGPPQQQHPSLQA